MWRIFGVGGAAAWFVLSVGERAALFERIGPVLVFLIAVTVLADIAAIAGAFDVLGALAVRLARGHTLLLYLLVMVLAAATTILFSLDTTAVLVTPVVVAISRAIGVRPWPFSIAVLWLANTGSLLLPVSNLTNLLAMRSLALSTSAYVALMWRPAVVAIVLTMLALVALYGGGLRGRHVVSAVAHVEDRRLLATAFVAVALFVILLAADVAPMQAALVAAAVAVAGAIRHHPARVRALFPWRLVVTVVGMFLVVAAIGDLGLRELVVRSVGARTDPLAIAGVAATMVNLLNNLPAYLLLDRVVPHALLPAVLVGTNLGPIVTPWASLATLLWAERLRRAGERVRWGAVVGAGALMAPVVVIAATSTLPR